MTRQLGVIMDPIATINPKKDTTLALLLAAQERAWDLWYMEQSDLALDGSTPIARQRPLRVHDDLKHWFELDTPVERPLAELDCILMRKDPPFDSEYIYSTYLLEAAERLGVLVVNRPASLRDCNEKLFATQFPQCTPPLLVSRDPARLRAFHRQHRDVIYKPLDAMGGIGIFRARDPEPNLSVIIETLTNHGRTTIMAQRYIPAIVDGDKRILVVDGEAVPYCLARVPEVGEVRGNLAAGGSGIVQELSERDRWIAAQVAPVLRERGLLFVGLDVIGDYLTEINVTSPTCAREIDREKDTRIGARLIDAIDRRLP
ncbi:MAG: glutathione synthase [Pseudomonadales bacterium]|nr:glutathione synthase [Pseudomonadales bacterium]